MDTSLQQAFGLGVKHSIFNNEVRKRREKLGLYQDELGKLCGVSGILISHIETFKVYPTKEIGEKIAEILNTKPEVLFPEWLKLFKLEKTSIITEHIITEPLLANTFNPLLLTDGQNIEDDVDKSFLKEEMSKQLNTLSDREKRVLIERFGLEDGRSKTLEEVGKMFHVTRERIRGIEGKALRKLRHPSRAKTLRAFTKEGVITKTKKIAIHLCKSCGQLIEKDGRIIKKLSWCITCRAYREFDFIRYDEKYII